MDSIRVRMNEWFFTQGLVGLKKIFEKYGEEVQTTEDGIIIERKHLDLITDAFFHYYLDEYSVARRDEKKLRILHKKFKEGDQTAKKDLNSELNDIKKKVAKYFSDTVEGKKLIEVADLYRKEKKYRPEMNDWLNTFNNMLHTKEINEKLTANFFKTVHLTPHFGQVSFLNVVNNKKSIEEQKEIFYKDFVLPVKEELELIDSLAEENETRLKKVLENINSKHLTSLAKQLKKQKTIDSMKNYIHEEVHKVLLQIYLWLYILLKKEYLFHWL